MYNNPGNKPKHIKRINPFTPLSGYRNSPKTLCVYTLVCVRVTTCTAPCRAEMWVSVRIVHSCTVRHRAEGVCVVCGWQCPILKCVCSMSVCITAQYYTAPAGQCMTVWQFPTTLGERATALGLSQGNSESIRVWVWVLGSSRVARHPWESNQTKPKTWPA